MMPETLDDAVLGRLDWEADMGWWAGQLELAGGETPEVFVAQTEADPGPAIARARRALGRLLEEEPAYRRAASSAIVDLVDQVRGPGPDPDLASRLRLDSVECRADGSFVVHYAVGRPAPGLVIALPVDPDGGPGRPRLEA